MCKYLTLLLFLTFSYGKAQITVEAISSFTADKSALERKYPNKLSDDYFQRFDKFYNDGLIKLNSLDFEKLNFDEKIDYTLLKNQITRLKYELNLEKSAFNELKGVIDFAGPLFTFINNRKKALKPNAQILSATFNEANKAINIKIEQLKNASKYTSWQEAELASDIVKELSKAIDEANGFYKDYNPEYYWWMQEPHKALKKNLEVYQTQLKTHFKNTSVFFIVAFLVGYSRIYLFQHFLIDVIFGAIIGLFISSIVLIISNLKNES